LRGQAIDLWLAIGAGRLPSATNLPIGRFKTVVPHRDSAEAPPRLLSVGYHPRFPDAAIRTGIGDSLIVEFVIDTTGRAEQHSIVLIRAGYREFAEEAIKAIMSARFAPGRIGTCPVAVRVQVPINFCYSRR
jgi:TonB family protein